MRGVAPTKAVRPADKFNRRRDELAESALATLGEMGYARASLREIANNSAFSHGVVHYYFQDKLELVIYSVRYYKARCVTRYDSVVSESRSAGELVDAFAAKLTQTIRDEAPMHRLWYDLRTQSMFEQELRGAVTEIDHTLEQMIWRVVSRYSELAGRPVALEPAVAYGLLDGLFQSALLGHLSGHATVLPDLVTQVRKVMPLMLA
jgi:TetR/AcrR family transcriptional regulator, transcriptional repressor of bet genes